MDTFRIQLSYVLKGSAESYPVEIKSSDAVTAAIKVAVSAMSMFKGVTKIRIQLLS